MCFGQLPYIGSDARNEENEDLTALREEISAWKGLSDTSQLRSDLPDRLYNDLKTLISPDPSLRPSAEDILLGIELGIGEDVASPSRQSMSPSKAPLSPGTNKPTPSAGAPLPSNPYDPNSLLSFRRISPVADTPPCSKSTSPVNGSSAPKITTTDYGTSRNGSLKPKDKIHLSTSGHVRQRSLLSEDPITIESLPPSPIAEDYEEHTLGRDARRSLSSGSVILRPQARSPPPAVSDPLLLAAPAWIVHPWRRRGSQLAGLGMAGKVVLFLLKVGIMTRPCGSSAVRGWVYYPLMALAGVDLAM